MSCVQQTAREEASLWRRSYVLRVLVINTMAAAVAVAFILIFAQAVTWNTVWTSTLHSLVFSHCIGALCGVVLPWLGGKLHRRPLPVKVAVVTIAVVLMAITGSLIASALLALTGTQNGAHTFANFFYALRFIIVVSLIAGLGAFLYHSMREQLEAANRELRSRELAAERANKLAAEARLSSLESRIHPHFLFNTLNSIASLTQEDPRKAEDTVGRLAALLRFSLDANQRSTVPIEQELKIVRDYLEIEKTRLGDRLRYSIEIPRELNEARVPPLAIESLVENSVKYVVAPRREGGEIRIRARAESGVLTVEVSDSGPGFALESAPSGHGIDNLTGRLDVLYPQRTRLELTRVDGLATVRLTLPLETV